jgi:hypothetical protein
MAQEGRVFRLISPRDWAKSIGEKFESKARPAGLLFDNRSWIFPIQWEVVSPTGGCVTQPEVVSPPGGCVTQPEVVSPPGGCVTTGRLCHHPEVVSPPGGNGTSARNHPPSPFFSVASRESGRRRGLGAIIRLFQPRVLASQGALTSPADWASIS